MTTNQFNIRDKDVVVAGGSKGLGRNLSLELVSRGAHVTALARSEKELEETRQQMELKKLYPSQRIEARSLDLVASQKVADYVNTLDRAPSAVFCVAGGTAEEVGFFVDTSPGSIRSCMEKNYLSSAYIANAVLKRWVSESNQTTGSSGADHHIIFTASTAALVAVPGYAAYAPTKAAIRSLADALRQESLMYRHRISIHVHCTFPGTIYTESFFREQKKKPSLCKQIEGSTNDRGGLSAQEIARLTLASLEAGKYFVTTDMQTSLLLNNMRGPSPKDSPVLDWLLGILASLIWPFFRMYFDRMTAKFGQSGKL